MVLALAVAYPVLIGIAIVLTSTGVIPFVLLLALALSAGFAWLYPDTMLRLLGSRIEGQVGRFISGADRAAYEPTDMGGRPAALRGADIRVTSLRTGRLSGIAVPTANRPLDNIVTVARPTGLAENIQPERLGALLGVRPVAVLGATGDIVCVHGSPLLAIPEGWVALDARREDVAQLLSPLLLPVHAEHVDQVLLVEMERPSVTGRAQVLLSAVSADGARVLVAGMDALAHEFSGTYALSRGRFVRGDHDSEGLVIHYPESESDGKVVEGATVAVSVGAVDVAWYSITAVVPAYSGADHELLEVILGVT